MGQNRIAALLGSRRVPAGPSWASGTLQGFTTNPLANVLTPAQTELYQTAYQLAQQDVLGIRWPFAEFWN